MNQVIFVSALVVGLVLAMLLVLVCDGDWREYMSIRPRYGLRRDFFDWLFDVTTGFFGDRWHGETRY